MNPTTTSVRSRTREAILEALAEVIIESDGIGFSVQAVADRAGVTHRTIYNHFPTRDALCDAFYDHVEKVLSIGASASATMSRQSLPEQIRGLYKALEQRDRYVRASVMLMIANRRAPDAWRNRTRAYEKWISRESSGAVPAKQVTAAMRMFLSSVGWHLLTEQIGLSNEEATATSVWATQTLLAAASKKKRSSSK